MIWFTSDTHFGHANVLHFADRPFGDIAHMNRALINAINERVAPTDDLYIFLVAFLAFALGAEGLFAIVAGVLAFTVGLMAAYGAITARAVERVVLLLVAFLAFALGAEGLFAIVAGVLAFTVGLMAAYGAITARAVERVVLPL